MKKTISYEDGLIETYNEEGIVVKRSFHSDVSFYNDHTGKIKLYIDSCGFVRKYDHNGKEYMKIDYDDECVEFFNDKEESIKTVYFKDLI